MYLSAEDARSDVILAGAAAAFGGILLALLLSGPGIPTGGVLAQLIVLASWFALSGLTPLLLARYRDDVPGAFALQAGDTPRDLALLLALPVVVLGVARGLLGDGSVLVATLGRAGNIAAITSSLGSGLDVTAIVMAVAGVIILTVGALLLVGFLCVRGRDAFRDDERPASELLRTFGLGAVAVAAIFGALRLLTSGANPLSLALHVLALAALVLVADRALPARAVVTRPAVLAPAIVVLISHVLQAGGLFGSSLPNGLYSGGLGAGTTVVLAVLIAHHRRAAVVIPLLLAIHWWPTCLSPLPFGVAGC